MKANHIVIILLLVLWAGTAGCSREVNGKADQARNGGRPTVAVEVATAGLGAITETVDVVGTLAPKFQAEVKAEYSGIVAEVNVTEWVRVKKGTPLAKLDSREVEAAAEAARAGLLQAEVSAHRAEREFERTVKLKAAGLATQQNLDDARTAKEAAAAALAAARAQLQAAETRLSKTVLRSPMNGVVALRRVNVGDFVGEPGTKDPLFRIVDNRLLDLTVTVPSARLNVLRVGQLLTFQTDAIPGKVFTGKVRFINPAAEEVSRSVKLIAEVPNPTEELKSGLFVKGQITTGGRTGVLQVPRAALLTWDVATKQAALFVVSSDTARRRMVQTGSVSGELVEVTSGLSAGEAVVTRGAFNLRDGDRVQVTAPKGA